MSVDIVWWERKLEKDLQVFSIQIIGDSRGAVSVEWSDRSGLLHQ